MRGPEKAGVGSSILPPGTTPLFSQKQTSKASYTYPLFRTICNPPGAVPKLERGVTASQVLAELRNARRRQPTS